ncbi:MAG: hypothetical protein OZSIB_1071 [Candidatus Ozemobacter sibiricus]|uniref:Uncharacterized protein n=1 Tax=Candidatus Ozemobacter sibiricus TaxID=2268124 RepID=A0A367Z7G3_9BACT|nr:MAG: hypothetical protein OZSIB_1071 [Candidatus Ozemobacter sibiricus]
MTLVATTGSSNLSTTGAEVATEVAPEAGRNETSTGGVRSSGAITGHPVERVTRMPPASATATTNDTQPAFGGVPETTPVAGSMASQAGAVASDHR